MAEDLMSCPFCGEKDISFSQDTTFRWLLASCDQCGACCSEVRIQTLGDGTKDQWLEQAKKDASAEWNRRPVEQQASRLDAAEKLVEKLEFAIRNNKGASEVEDEEIRDRALAEAAKWREGKE